MFGRSAPTWQRGPRAGWRVAAFPLLAATAAVMVALAWVDPSVLCAVPALVLPAVLALRRYPGEAMLLALLPARRTRRRRPGRLAPRRIVHLAAPRGGLLLARSLAVRPPPGSLLAR